MALGLLEPKHQRFTVNFYIAHVKQFHFAYTNAAARLTLYINPGTSPGVATRCMRTDPAGQLRDLRFGTARRLLIGHATMVYHGKLLRIGKFGF